MKKTEIRNCLRDLRLTDPLEDRNILKRKKGNHAHGTCEWIIRTKEITAWLESEQENILWLYGYPGTGKSTMAIFLTEELSRVFSTTEGKTLAYFFCDSGDEKRKTATSIIRGLLLQLVEQCPPLLDYLLSKYNDRGPEVFQTFDALWPIFMAAVVDQSTGRKYCIIDALDECDEGSQETLLMQLEETLSNSAFTSNIRILVTSRPYPLIDGYLRRFAAKDLGSFPERKEDIDLYIKERLENLSERQHYTAKVREKASKILREKAGGTFLWVGLACEELRGTPSNRLFQALESIPEGLDSLYKELLDAALQQKWAREKTIRHILSFVAFSLRPLSVLEISEACQLHLDEDDPDTREQYTREDIASCRLMVIIQDGEVQLLHQSVRDYLERTRHLDKLEEHANLAYRCIDLLMKEFHCIEPGPIYFSDYAAHNWPNHARMAESKFVISGSRAQFFDVDSPCRTQWLARLRRKDRFLNRISDFSLWHIAARWGLSTLARYLHNKASQMKCLDISNYVSSEGVTPLELAAQSQYPDVISVLLKLGGKLTTRVLKAAARNEETGKEVMVLLLIHCEDHLTITEEVLMAAAGNRVNAEGVMKLLLDHPGEYITITNRVVNAAISNWGNAEGVTRLLLDYRRDQFSITKYMIEAAARNRGNGEGVMKLLLDRRGDQFTITEGVVKAAAGNWGNGEGVMKLLLDRRGDQFTITEEVVKAAAGNWGNGDRVMKLLLDRRGDQFTITEEVIKAAARNRGNGEGMMKLLLNRRGDQVTITEEVVKAAAGNRGDGEGVVKVLLDHPGEKITITDGMINTAAKNRINGDSVMKLLLEHFERRENLISP
ncbi:hypothetical protein N7490_003199 [Penicillium lividum]|nr:hypothetical protein N7490_003199 [Penicillium lividum]